MIEIKDYSLRCNDRKKRHSKVAQLSSSQNRPSDVWDLKQTAMQVNNDEITAYAEMTSGKGYSLRCCNDRKKRHSKVAQLPSSQNRPSDVWDLEQTAMKVNNDEITAYAEMTSGKGYSLRCNDRKKLRDNR